MLPLLSFYLFLVFPPAWLAAAMRAASGVAPLENSSTEPLQAFPSTILPCPVESSSFPLPFQPQAFYPLNYLISSGESRPAPGPPEGEPAPTLRLLSRGPAPAGGKVRLRWVGWAHSRAATALGGVSPARHSPAVIPHKHAAAAPCPEAAPLPRQCINQCNAMRCRALPGRSGWSWSLTLGCRAPGAC